MAEDGLVTQRLQPGQVAEVEQLEPTWRRIVTLPPEDAAARILQGIERRQPRVPVGKDAERAAWMQRPFPVGEWKLVARDIARRVGRPAGPSSKESR